MEEKHEYAFCCTHAMNCAVHETPYDTQYVACTCYVHTGSLRHQWIGRLAAIPQLNQERRDQAR